MNSLNKPFMAFSGKPIPTGPNSPNLSFFSTLPTRSFRDLSIFEFIPHQRGPEP